MKKTGPKNRGSHPDGLPLARSGLYISCAYLPVNSLKSATRSSGFSDLLFHDTLAPHLASVEQTFLSASPPDEHRQECLCHLFLTLNAPSHPIRNRRLRLTADSPSLLAVIKQEGKV